MEMFKVCEKETKTKAYSKEGLARAAEMSPEEQAKADAQEVRVYEFARFYVGWGGSEGRDSSVFLLSLRAFPAPEY